MTYGVRTVLDLRSPEECASDVPIPGAFGYERVSLFAHYDEDATYRDDLSSRLSGHSVASKYRALYAEALDLDRGHFARAFGFLADRDRAVLFHCVGGKDRTGVLAALILRLAGASIEDIEADYIHTETRAQGRTKAPHINSSAPAGVITEVLTDLEAQHGSIRGYLLYAGVSNTHLTHITRALLVDSTR